MVCGCVAAAFVGRFGQFASFAGRRQRSQGWLYLRGLMLDGRRESMVPTAERLGWAISGCGSSSPPRTATMRRRLAVRAHQAVGAVARVLDGSGHLKDGDASG
ncbi:transposase [Nonomuraea jabiensis]|uniref:transposase n=1 Tax=Nonomuraea jabiensis TaxID=882448 RepID=UPI003428B972